MPCDASAPTRRHGFGLASRRFVHTTHPSPVTHTTEPTMAESSFGYVKTLAAADIATARPQVEAALKEHGFGVLT